MTASGLAAEKKAVMTIRLLSLKSKRLLLIVSTAAPVAHVHSDFFARRSYR
jgi:hypothetical protein